MAPQTSALYIAWQRLFAICLNGLEVLSFKEAKIILNIRLEFTFVTLPNILAVPSKFSGQIFVSNNILQFISYGYVICQYFIFLLPQVETIDSN